MDLRLKVDKREALIYDDDDDDENDNGIIVATVHLTGDEQYNTDVLIPLAERFCHTSAQLVAELALKAVIRSASEAKRALRFFERQRVIARQPGRKRPEVAASADTLTLLEDLLVAVQQVDDGSDSAWRDRDAAMAAAAEHIDKLRGGSGTSANRRPGLHYIPCSYCWQVDCNYDCDESQAGGFQEKS
jgi:hypothetical protein